MEAERLKPLNKKRVSRLKSFLSYQDESDSVILSGDKFIKVDIVVGKKVFTLTEDESKALVINYCLAEDLIAFLKSDFLNLKIVKL